MSIKSVGADGEQSGIETIPFPAALPANNGCLLEELDNILKRGLLLLHTARSEMHAVQCEKDELSQSSGFMKTQVSDEVVILKNATQPPSPSQPYVTFGAPEGFEDALSIGDRDDTVAGAHVCRDEDQAPESTNYDSADFDPILCTESLNRSSLVSSDADGDQPKVDTAGSTKSRFDTAVSHLSHKSSRGATQKLKLRAKSTLSLDSDMQPVVRPRAKRSPRSMAIESLLDDPESSRLAGYLNAMISIVIQVSVCLSLWQTVESPVLDMNTFVFIQITLDAIFFAELVLRLCVCSNVKMFMLNGHNIIDFVAAVLPLSLRAAWFLGVVSVQNEGIAKYIVFCVAPVLREMKILRRVQQFNLFAIVLRDIMEAVQTLLMLLMMTVLIFSSLLYIFEPRSNIPSMPRAIWYTIVTMTTVGYGDITPETTLGHLIASILALYSVLYMAMPIGIIGNAFTKTWQDRDFILLMIKTRGAMLKFGYGANDLPGIVDHYSDGTGVLILEDFLNMVKDMNLRLNSDRALKVFEWIDRDGDGRIDEQEFVRTIFPSEYHVLYPNKKESGIGIADTDAHFDFSVAPFRAVEAITDFGRQFTPGLEKLHNKFRQISPGGRVSPHNGESPPEENLDRQMSPGTRVSPYNEEEDELS